MASGSDDDVEARFRAVPPELVAEILDGELHVSPRPDLRHAAAATALGEELGPPFKRGRGGPGGWILLFEPEIHLGPRPDKLVPDLAGWRRERMPELPDEAATSVSPDRVCEVLSDRTRRTDRMRKMPIYAREGVKHVWLIDPSVKTLEIFRLEQSAWVLAAAYVGEECVRAEPFDAIELDLAALWAR